MGCVCVSVGGKIERLWTGCNDAFLSGVTIGITAMTVITGLQSRTNIRLCVSAALSPSQPACGDSWVSQIYRDIISMLQALLMRDAF